MRTLTIRNVPRRLADALQRERRRRDESLKDGVFRVLGERARDEGVEGGRGGAVVVIQRSGSGLNLNVHFHALVLDAPVRRRLRRA